MTQIVIRSNRREELIQERIRRVGIEEPRRAERDAPAAE